MKKMMTMLLAAVLMLTVAGCGAQGTATSQTDVITDKQPAQTPDVSAVLLDEAVTYYADIEIADYGTVTVQLDQSAAPVTAANFVNLAKNGFYDGLTFHRIMAGFMMQGGDPKGNGTGGSDTKIKGEFAANGHDNPISHKRGVISMARSGENPWYGITAEMAYNSASSQFFIMHRDAPGLDGQYAAFGWVTSGIEIVDAICADAEPTDNNGTIPAAKQPVIETIRVTEIKE